MSRTILLALVSLLSLAPAHATQCPVEKAVYLADNRLKDFPPDELRFSFEPTQLAKPWDGFPTTVRLKSAEIKRELVFDTYFTNNSGVQGVTVTIPEEDLPEQLKQERKEQRETAERLKEAAKSSGDKPQSDPMSELADILEEQEPFTIASMAFVVTQDFKVQHFPAQGDPAPMLVMFPGFRPWAHSSNNGVVSAGIMWGVFRFERCTE